MSHTEVLIRETLREAEHNRPGRDDRQQVVTTAHNELVEAVRIAPAAVRTLKVALRLRDLLLLERLAAEARKAQRSTQAQAAAALRVASVDYDPEQVRTWAAAHGIAVPRQGRFLPGAVIHAYREAQRSPDPTGATDRPAPGARSARSSSPETATGAKSRSRRQGAPASSRRRTPGTSSPTPTAAPSTQTTSEPSAKRTRRRGAAKSDTT